MATYRALRRYPNTFHCANRSCACSTLNPTVLYRISGQTGHCIACGGLATCPDCFSPIVPSKQASNGAPFWNGECSPSCPGTAAKGLPTTPKAAPSTSSSTASGALPVVDPRLQARQIRLTERIMQAVHTAKAFEHNIPTVLVLDLSSKGLPPVQLTCSECGAFLRISLEDAPDSPFYGTAATFHCSRLQKGRKP